MIRKILGFAAVAFVALVVFKIALGLLGLLVGLAVATLVLAAMGYGFYLLLRIASPTMADRVQEVIRGRPATTP